MGDSKLQACLVILTLLVLITLASARVHPSKGRSTTNNLNVDSNNLLGGIRVNGTQGNNNPNILCSGKHFGFHPNILDCQSAREQLAPDFTERIWGQRHHDISEAYVPLPYRMMGGELYGPRLLRTLTSRDQMKDYASFRR